MKYLVAIAMSVFALLTVAPAEARPTVQVCNARACGDWSGYPRYYAPRHHYRAKVRHHKKVAYVKRVKKARVTAYHSRKFAVKRHRVVRHTAPKATGYAAASYSFGGGSGLVARARAYLGAGPAQVGVRRDLWCSAFVRKMTGATGVDDRAVSWLRKPRIGKQVGAIAVMGRRGGGHVGIVTGFTAKGDPIIIAGNAGGNRVREYPIPAGRIYAYVSPR